MFRTSVCPSSGVQVVYFCMWCSAPGVVAVVLRSRCVVLCTACKFVASSWYLSSFSYTMHGHTYITITTELSRSDLQKFSCNLLLGFPIVLFVLPAASMFNLTCIRRVLGSPTNLAEDFVVFLSSWKRIPG